MAGRNAAAPTLKRARSDCRQRCQPEIPNRRPGRQRFGQRLVQQAIGYGQGDDCERSREVRKLPLPLPRQQPCQSWVHRVLSIRGYAVVRPAGQSRLVSLRPWAGAPPRYILQFPRFPESCDGFQSHQSPALEKSVRSRSNSGRPGGPSDALSLLPFTGHLDDQQESGHRQLLALWRVRGDLECGTAAAGKPGTAADRRGAGTVHW